MKLTTDILIDHGFRPPFTACAKNRGSVVDRGGKFVPILPLPGYLSDDERERCAADVAAMLNAQAGVDADRAAA